MKAKVYHVQNGALFRSHTVYAQEKTAFGSDSSLLSYLIFKQVQICPLHPQKKL